VIKYNCLSVNSHSTNTYNYYIIGIAISDEYVYVTGTVSDGEEQTNVTFGPDAWKIELPVNGKSDAFIAAYRLDNGRIEWVRT
jgi:hypothetical protein